VESGSSECSQRRTAASGARASAGGARASGGVGNQARIAAWVGSLILADQPPKWLIGDARLIALGGETGLAVDDVGALTDRDGLLLIQAKGRLQLSSRPTSEFARAVDQVVRQFIDGVPTSSGRRPIDEQRDRLVIAADGRSSVPIKELATVTNRLRTLPAARPISSVATNARQKRALTTLLSHIRESWTATSSSDPSDEETRALLSVLAVDVLDLEDGGSDRAAAGAHLAAVLLDAKNEVRAWRGLTALGQRISEQRAWRRRSDIAAELDEVGAPVGPGRSHAANVRMLRRVSEANLGALSAHSAIQVHGEIVRSQRSAIDDLAGVNGSFVILGDPGCGKSGVVHELASRIATTEDILLLTVEGLPDTGGAAQVELGLDADLLETLKEWTGSGRATLILDGLDAARGEGTAWLARLSEELRGTRWRVIATIRRFDLRRNLAWQRVFRASGDPLIASSQVREFSDVRHYLLGDLSDGDLEQLATASPGIARLLHAVSTRVLALVRNPFNLRLAVELMEAGASVASLAEIRDQLHLMQRYWRLRVTDASDGSSRARVLAVITEEMLKSGQLRVDASILPHALIDTADNLLHDGVLDAAPSPLLASGMDVLVFSHHILFDYAVAALILTSRGDSQLIALLDVNPNLALIGRPSIDLHLTDLWHAELGRSLFAKVVRELASHNHAVAGIGAARVAAEQVQHHSDIEWLLAYLREDPQSATIFVNWICGVMDAAEVELASRITNALPIWADVTANLIQAAERRFDPATALTLFRLLFQLDKIDPLNAASRCATVRASSAARLFVISLDDYRERAWLAARAARLLPRAIAVDGAHAKTLRRLTNESEVLDALGPEVMEQFVEDIDLIADGDPDLAAALLSEVWRWDEHRDETTHLTQGVLNLTSTRKQDVDHLKWLLGERFPAFLATAGLLRSIPVLTRVLSSDIDAYEGHADEEITAFGVVGQLRLLAPDLRHGPGHGAAAKVVDAFLDALPTSLPEADIADVIKALVSSVTHPEFWGRILLAATQLPPWQVPVARVLSSGALLINTETRAAAGQLMRALSGKLDDQEHVELLETPIQRAAAFFPPGKVELRDSLLDQLIACLEVEKIQDPALRSRLRTQLAAGNPRRPPEPSRAEAFWLPLELSDILGAEVHDGLTESARDALGELHAALTTTEGDAADNVDTSDLEHALVRTVETDGLDAEPAQELITHAAERLARERHVQPATRLGELVATVLIDATNGDSLEISSQRTMPTVWRNRVVGTARLFRRDEWRKSERGQALERIMRSAMDDEDSVIRFQASQVIRLLEPDRRQALALIRRRLLIDSDHHVAAALASQLASVATQLPSEVDAVAAELAATSRWQRRLSHEGNRNEVAPFISLVLRLAITHQAPAATALAAEWFSRPSEAPVTRQVFWLVRPWLSLPPNRSLERSTAFELLITAAKVLKSSRLATEGSDTAHIYQVADDLVDLIYFASGAFGTEATNHEPVPSPRGLRRTRFCNPGPPHRV
jgi:hypothetical protein